jgi:hypothetical protein
MCIGLPQWGKQRIIYLIDFGMARKFLQPDGELRLERSRAAFRGTTRYVSMTVHERKETVSRWLAINLKHLAISIHFSGASGRFVGTLLLHH